MSGSAVKNYRIVTNGNLYRIQEAYTSTFVMGPVVYVNAIFTVVPTQTFLEFSTVEEAQDWIDKNTWRVV